MRPHLRAGIFGLITTTLFTGSALASPVDLYGFGTISPAMGATGVATSRSYESLYLNPAGLGGLRLKRFTVGGQVGKMNLTYNGDKRDVDSHTGLLAGGELPLRLGGWFKERVALAIGVVVPPNAINKARAPLPGDPWFSLLETRSQTVNMHLGLGLRISKNLRAGISAVSLATLEGQLNVTVDGAGRFTTFSQQRLVTKLTPIVGVQYAVPDWNMDFGLVMRGKLATAYSITITNDLADVLPVTIPVVEVAGTSQFTPLQVVAEVAWEPRPTLRGNLQVAYMNWSDYPLPTENATINTPAQEPPGFSDTIVPRLGVEWDAVDNDTLRLQLRGGYQFVMSPAPEMDGQQSLFDNHRHVLSTGFGMFFPGISKGMFVDGWFQFHGLVPRRHVKDPSKFEPDERLPYSIAQTRGQIYIGGISVGLYY